eukprot:TRINITY_DN5411_c0_g1_i1.p1 TRINITY_DN5411_c0_g1~~TRINITY_DN5411_c0_g1_i1.p1  ORF type:complete len:210 (-),score=40.18 TRINITY_DN5411_c0_g1_i1:130-759(-)
MSNKPIINIFRKKIHEHKAVAEVNNENRPSIDIFNLFNQNLENSNTLNGKNMGEHKNNRVIQFTDSQNIDRADLPSRKERRPISAEINRNIICNNIISKEIYATAPRLYSITDLYREMENENELVKGIFSESDEDWEDIEQHIDVPFPNNCINHMKFELNNSLHFNSIESPKAFVFGNLPQPSSGCSGLIQRNKSLVSSKSIIESKVVK